MLENTVCSANGFLGIYEKLLSIVAPAGHVLGRLDMIADTGAGTGAGAGVGANVGVDAGAGAGAGAGSKSSSSTYSVSRFCDSSDTLLLSKGDMRNAPVAFVASAATRGLEVCHIHENGFVSFIGAPASPMFALAGKRVRFENGAVGVIARDGKTESDKPIAELAAEHMCVDLGSRSAEESGTLVKIGEGGVISGMPAMAGSEAIVSPYLSDLAGCAVLLRLMEVLDTGNACFAFTSKPGVIPDAILGLSPKTVIYIDAAEACCIYAKGKLNIGGGAAFHPASANPLCGEALAGRIIEAARTKEIAMQWCYSPSPLAFPHSGIPVARISVPVRYCREPSEMVRSADLESCAALAITAMDCVIGD